MTPTYIRLEHDLVVHRDRIDRAHFTKSTNGVHAGWLDLHVSGELLDRQYSGERALALWHVIAGLSLPSGNYAKGESAATLWTVMQKWLTTLSSLTSLRKGKRGRGRWMGST